jgi:fructose-specific phosphotransferase system IIC component
MRLDIICIPCIIAGSAMVLTATTAFAAPQQMPGPSWEFIATGFGGILLAILGGYVKGISTRVDKLADACDDLKEIILRDYLSKGDVNAVLAKLESGITKLNEKFDDLSRERGHDR